MSKQTKEQLVKAAMQYQAEKQEAKAAEVSEVKEQEAVVTEEVVEVVEVTPEVVIDPVEAELAKLNEAEVKLEEGEELITTTPDATAAERVDAKLDLILKALPAEVTPKTLCTLFAFDDGGKLVRRHLRKKYGEGHDHKATWAWKKDDSALVAIVKYFADKYTAHPETLAVKAVAK